MYNRVENCCWENIFAYLPQACGGQNLYDIIFGMRFCRLNTSMCPVVSLCEVLLFKENSLLMDTAGMEMPPELQQKCCFKLCPNSWLCYITTTSHCGSLTNHTLWITVICVGGLARSDLYHPCSQCSFHYHLKEVIRRKEMRQP